MSIGRAGKASAEATLAVWAAEDGRCEACARPMDRRWARVGRVDDRCPDYTVENLHLLCVDCKSRRQDPLVRLTLGGEVAARVLGQMGADEAEQASRWLVTSLRRYGVLVWVGREARSYWLPGIGKFRVELQPDGTATVTTVAWLTAAPQLKVQPQARTRGLPRPDRRPLAAAGD